MVSVSSSGNSGIINPVFPQGEPEDPFMSDTITLRKYPRQAITPLGTNRRKKYLVLFFALIIAAVAGSAYQAYSSGILADENPRIPGQVLDRINLERQVNNLDPVRLSDSLTYDATRISREVRTSPLLYQFGDNPSSTRSTNIFVLPKISWAVPGYDFLQQVFIVPGSDDRAFLENIHDPAHHSVGIGVSGDSYNYYLVTTWE
jgi:hypothetical protein